MQAGKMMDESYGASAAAANMRPATAPTPRSHHSDVVSSTVPLRAPAA